MCPGLMKKGREEVGTVRHGFNNALRIDSDSFVVFCRSKKESLGQTPQTQVLEERHDHDDTGFQQKM